MEVRRTEGHLLAAFGRNRQTRCDDVEAAGEQARDQGSKLGHLEFEVLDAQIGEGGLENVGMPSGGFACLLVAKSPGRAVVDADDHPPFAQDPFLRRFGGRVPVTGQQQRRRHPEQPHLPQGLCSHFHLSR
ncbi:hypothetical protein LRS09_29200 [Mesorhizobium sp. J428]|nr:hypothetical protein [Mesorhizobium sp. J428]